MTATGQGSEPLEAEDLFGDPDFARPTISPDGTRLAYLAPAHGRRNIWVRGIDEEHHQALRHPRHSAGHLDVLLRR